MKQTARTQKSIQDVLDGALKCFASQGYRGTSIKDIANTAGMSTGRIYHHFDSKLEIFEMLLERYWAILGDPDLELNRLIAQAQFPDDFEQVALAIKQVVEENHPYVMLIYIDVIEFQGTHINRIYRNMASQFRRMYRSRFADLADQGRLNPKADPFLTVMMTFRFFFHYFIVETSFGVKDHFGFGLDRFIAMAKETMMHGLLKPEN